MQQYEFHPLANIFPLMEGDDFARLVHDIKENGQREPIVITEDSMILDGRNRYRACMESGVAPTFDLYRGTPDSMASFVVSLNLHRRHLNESQRGIVSAKLANMVVGGKETNSANLQNCPPVSQAASAELLNVSTRTVASAKKVIEEGAPELVREVERGNVSVSAAADVATLPKAEQVQIVARGEREILQAAKEIRAAKAESRREERLDKIAEISRGNSELNTETRYPVIYADPPWRYEQPPMGDTNRSIENHYPTMSLDEICALPVGDLANEDAILYLWATAPKLAECMKVIEAWGFEYRTCMVWDKEKIGMGYYARNQHELLLICRRGQIPPPSPGTQPASVFREARGDHSAKPTFFYDMIEQSYPGLPKIELFCRSPREGWQVWGNQSGAAA